MLSKGNLSDVDFEILKRQESNVLAQWYCMLNSFEWPAELPNPEPTPDDVGPQNYKADGRRDTLMGWIVENVGAKACSREWNKRMTDEEFDDFWRGVHEGDVEAYERWRQSLPHRRKQRTA